MTWLIGTQLYTARPTPAEPWVVVAARALVRDARAGGGGHQLTGQLAERCERLSQVPSTAHRLDQVELSARCELSARAELTSRELRAALGREQR